MQSKTLLAVNNLVKRYDGRAVVNKLSFRVGPGEIVGLLGRNGAGKTTSFRITVGMIDAEEGSVMFEDRDVTSLAMYRRAQLGMGYLSQEPSVFQRLTVEENILAILETMRGMTRAERLEKAAHLVEQFGLIKQRKQLARTLSGGERRKLEIARALVTDPKLIMLDEPFSGVDPKAVEDLQQEILHLKRDRGIAILAICGNIVTAWSWFGVNELEAGLHSYGFIDGTVLWILRFVVLQLVIIAIGLVPVQYWWSHREQQAEKLRLKEMKSTPSELHSGSPGGQSQPA